MSEPELIQQQRELLHDLRQAITQRNQAETDANARLERQHSDAEAALNAARKQVDMELAKLDEGEKFLNLPLTPRWVREIQIFPPQEASSTQPFQELTSSAAKGLQALAKLKARSTNWMILAYVGFLVALCIPCYCVVSLYSSLASSVVQRNPSTSGIIGLIGLLVGISLLILYFVAPGVAVYSWYKRTEGDRKDLYFRVKQSIADSEYWHQYVIHNSQETYSRAFAQSRDEHERTEKENQQNFELKLAEITTKIAILNTSADATSPKWSDPVWYDETPLGTLSPITRIGEMQIEAQQESFALRALLPFPSDRSLLFRAGGKSKLQVGQTIQSLMLRLLATIPPGKIRFTFIDPVGLGQNVAPFMQLADYDENFVSGKAWTEPQHIEQRLSDLTEHMENVIQKYLRNQFETIEEYNASAGEVAEPYRVLVVLDFPTNFSETAARRLVSIASNGPRCGVYALVNADTGKPLPYGFTMGDLERAATVIAWDGQRFVWQDDDFRDCLLELDTPPDAKLFDRIIKTVGEASQEASKVVVPFERIAPPQNQWWTGDSRAGLRAPLGPSGARKVQFLDLGKGTAQHVLVAGKTGSGKSTLLHTIITNLALSYSPGETELYLVDFKKGVEFKTYATHQLPHARVIAIESEREFGLSVLQGLDAELKRRGDLFRATSVDDLKDYR